MMEAMSERERYIKNPLRLLRCAQELASFALRAVDDNLYDFLPYNEVNYPPCGPAEAPVATEEELIENPRSQVGDILHTS